MLTLLRKMIKYTTPRYNFAYDNSYYDEKKKSLICILKVFADHTFIKVCARTILKEDQYKYNIPPDDLLIINDKYNAIKSSSEQLSIKEQIRGNKYKIGNNKRSEIYDANEILKNEDLMESLNHKDIFRVAYNKGLADGRAISKQIQESEQNKKQGACSVIRLVNDT